MVLYIIYCVYHTHSVQSAQDMWQNNLAQLEQQYSITDPSLLIRSVAVLLVVILLFFLASVIPGIELELGECVCVCECECV